MRYKSIEQSMVEKGEQSIVFLGYYKNYDLYLFHKYQLDDGTWKEEDILARYGECPQDYFVCRISGVEEAYLPRSTNRKVLLKGKSKAIKYLNKSIQL
jgi:hypothetical protein